MLPCLIAHKTVLTSGHGYICIYILAKNLYGCLDGQNHDFLLNQTDEGPSWDDWVPQSRLRKYSEENLELAKMLKRELDNQRTQTKPATDKRASIVKKQGRDSSARISENLSPAPQVAAKKRGRDNETERVSRQNRQT